MRETQHLEWKASWRDEYLRWICGFANAEGCTLVIGRNDKGVAVGVADSDALMAELPNKVRDLLGIIAEVDLRVEDGKDLGEIRVAGYPSPISFRGKYYLRSGSTNQLLRGAALDQFLLRKRGKSWDSTPVPDVSPADLDASTLATFRKLATRSRRLPESVLNEPDEHLLEKLELMDGAYLSLAAVLLFHPEPQRYVGGSYVKIGYFETGANLQYQDEVSGSLLRQVDRVMEILTAKYLRAWITYEGIQRVETFPVPVPALREVVLNAVAHKDYSTGIPIQIKVFPDKLFVWSPGRLPLNWTVDKLFSHHPSVPFNPRIASVFFRGGMIEAWGRGYERILEACSENRTPLPDAEYEPSGLGLMFRFLPEHQAKHQRSADREAKPGDREQRRPQVTLQVTPQVTPQVIRLLGVLSSDMGRESLQSALQLRDRKSFRNLYLQPAIEAGLVTMTIPDKPRSQHQKYRLTEAGREFKLRQDAEESK